MIQSTKDLIAYLNLTDKQLDYSIVGVYIDAILSCGTKADANALLACFLKKPNDPYRSDLLKVIREFGDETYAQQLADKCFNNEVLIENIPEDVLEIMGFLKYEPYKSILSKYVFGQIQSDYCTEKAAILGLLPLDCTEYQELILQEIQKCYGQGLFSEFVPALVCKLNDRTETLEKLYQLGKEHASTDCISGIILGFSLCGEEGRPYFKRILFDPDWECCDRGTGSTAFTYQGVKNLNISFRDLYQQVLAVENEPELTYRMEIFLALLESGIRDRKFAEMESLTELFELLFAWENPNKRNHFWSLIDQVEKQDQGYSLETALIQKMREATILSNYQNKME